MLKILFRSSIVIVALGVSVAVAVLATTTPKTTKVASASPDLLSFELLGPGTEVGAGPIIVNPQENVHLRYRVTNVSQRVLLNVRPDLNCGCSLIERLPAEMNPGQEGIVAFRVRAPYAGQRETRVAFTSGSLPTKVGQVTVSLAVSWDPPALARPPKPFETTCVLGRDSHRTVNFETVEAAESEPWIDSISMASGAVAEVVSIDVSEHGISKGLVTRVYHVRIAFNATKTGRHRTQLHFQTRDSIRESSLPPILVDWEVFSPVAAIPNEVHFSIGDAAGASRMIRLLSRVGEQTLQPVEFDEGRFSLTQVADNEWQICTLRALVSETTDSIVFRSDTGETVEVPIRVGR